MATNYPTSVDAYTRPLTSDPMNVPSHAGEHDNAYDAVEAIETKLGTGSSTAVANSVLAGTAAGVTAWSTTPRLANIADTGGTTRITIGTAAPMIAITGTQTITGTASTTAATTLLDVGATLTNITNDGQIHRGVSGTFGVLGKSGDTTQSIFGLDYFVQPSSNNVTTGYATAYGVSAQVLVKSVGNSSVPTVTSCYGVYTKLTATRAGGLGTPTITTGYGVYVEAPTKGTGAVITTYYGMAIVNTTAPTTTRLLEIGGTIGTTPYFRVAGNFTAAANQTPIYVSEGATPTLRQLKTFDPGNLGINFTAGQLVAVLV